VVVDENGSPVPDAVIEIWQANAAGRYFHAADDAFEAPLDPNFVGVGRCRTDAAGGYRFTTIRPGPYPWRNHPNAWRPAHVHLSLLGPAFATRLVTQLYFPDDPLLAIDPIFQSVPRHARDRLVARYDHGVTRELWALGYRFDVVLRGPRATPGEPREVTP
jgi:protocatechuate 3,4-dioxygenase beta subunit